MGKVSAISWTNSTWNPWMGCQKVSEACKFCYMYQFRDTKTPIFFKQFGTWYSKNKFKLKDWKGEKYCSRFPKSFQIREYPNLKTLKNGE